MGVTDREVYEEVAPDLMRYATALVPGATTQSTSVGSGYCRLDRTCEMFWAFLQTGDDVSTSSTVRNK